MDRPSIVLPTSTRTNSTAAPAPPPAPWPPRRRRHPDICTNEPKLRPDTDHSAPIAEARRLLHERTRAAPSDHAPGRFDTRSHGTNDPSDHRTRAVPLQSQNDKEPLHERTRATASTVHARPSRAGTHERTRESHFQPSPASPADTAASTDRRSRRTSRGNGRHKNSRGATWRTSCSGSIAGERRSRWR